MIKQKIFGWQHPLSLAAMWVLLSFILNPIGEFPLNDDWAFARTVSNLVEKGKFELCDWVGFPLFTQTLWGAVFCLPFGFSFTALRISTLTAGLIGIIATYQLLLDASGNKRTAWLGTLPIAVNPLFFGLSYTFMSDVPFYTLLILCILFFQKYMNGNRNKDLVLATLFAILATLNRQIALAAPLAFILVHLFGKNSKTVILKSMIPFLLSMAAIFIYNQWLEANDNVPAYYYKHYDTLNSNTVSMRKMFLLLLKNGWFVVIYLSLFLLPLFLLYAKEIFQLLSRHKLTAITCGLFVIGISFLNIFQGHKMMPLLGNIIMDCGIGPITIHDATRLENNLLTLPVWCRKFLLYFGILVSVIAIAITAIGTKQALSSSTQSDKTMRTRKYFFILLFMLIYTLPLLLIDIFDRHLLPLIPCLLLLMQTAWNSSNSKKNSLLYFTVLLPIFIFSILATHDYLSWNRARWQAGDFLMKEKKIPHDRMDGGFEMTCWYGFPENLDKRVLPRWWTDEYVITFGYINGFREIKRFHFPQWLRGNQGTILVLEKEKRN